MPKYSKTGVILTGRGEENKLLLPQRDGKTRRQRDEEPELLILPAFACKVCVTRLETEENFIEKAVVSLARIKREEGLDPGQVYDYVSKKLCLDRILVKAVLKRSDNAEDAETGEKNQRSSGAYYYVFYDPITCAWYPRAMEAELYERNSFTESLKPERIIFSAESQEVRFQLSKGGNRYFARWISTGDRELSCPTRLELPAWLSTRYFGKERHKVAATGQVELIGMVCACYVRKDNLSSIHTLGPMGKYAMPWLFEVIRSGLQRCPEQNGAVSDRLQQLEQIRKRKLDQRETFADAHNATKEATLLCYPGISRYDALWEQLSRFGSLTDTKKTGLSDSERKDALISFHTVLEELLALALCNGLPKTPEKNQMLNELTASLDGRRNNGLLIGGIAESVGFPNADGLAFYGSGNERIRTGIVRTILRNAAAGADFPKSLPEMTIALLLAASCDERHAFRAAAHLCPGLLGTVNSSLRKRNYYKHGMDKQEGTARDRSMLPGRDELVRMKTAVDVLLSCLLSIERVSDEEREKNEREHKARKDALIRAVEELERWPTLKKKLPEQAEEQLFRYYYQDAEYFSSCTNLLSGVLDQLLSEKSDMRQREQAAAFFSEDIRGDAAAIEALLASYGCDYHSEDRPNTRKLRSGYMRPHTLTLKNKFFLTVVLLDTEHPDFLRELLKTAPRLSDCIDKSCIWRAHSNAADFRSTKDRYQTFQTELLTSCEQALLLLLKGDEDGEEEEDELSQAGGYGRQGGVNSESEGECSGETASSDGGGATDSGRGEAASGGER